MTDLSFSMDTHYLIANKKHSYGSWQFRHPKSVTTIQVEFDQLKVSDFTAGNIRCYQNPSVSSRT
jgi:hypothetical protein